MRYRRTDNPDGPLITVRRADVFMIRYASGTKEMFDSGQNAPQAVPAPPAPPAAPLTGPVVPGDEESAYDEIHLSGPRIGFTVLTPRVLDRVRDRTNMRDFGRKVVPYFPY